VFIGGPDAEQMVHTAGLDFVPFCEEEYPAGSVAKLWGEVAKLHGIGAMEYTAANLMPGLLKAALEH
jgi:zeaxanthin glucosyltransferase